MKKPKDILISGSLIAMGVWLWAKETGALDGVPIIGPFFWPSKAPSSVLSWLDTVEEQGTSWKTLILSIIWQESNGVHYTSNGDVIRGADGEIGLCQILPATGAGLGFSEIDLMDPVKNILACSAYLDEAAGAWDDYYTANPPEPPEVYGTSIHDICRYYNGGPRVVQNHSLYINLSRSYADQVVHKYDVLADELLEIQEG